MSTDVLRLQGDYLIQTKVNSSGVSTGGSLTLDVGSQSGVSTGTVYVNGNLVVRGTQSTINTIDTAIKDTTITLNAGEVSTAISGSITTPGSNGYSGLKISRGRNGLDQDQFAAFLEFNNNARWQGTGAISSIAGVWEFRTGKTGRPQYSAIKVNAIRIDELSASTAGSGAGQGSRLNIFGSDNPTSVLSVSGTNNYEARVTDRDDIPNKAYVDKLMIQTNPTAERVVIGNSYVTLTDKSVDTIASQILGVLDGNPTERTEITTGTVVMRITKTVAAFSGIQLVDNQIESTGTDRDLNLSANGKGQIVFKSPILFETGTEPEPGLGQTGLYVSTPAGGGTGVFFVQKDLLGVKTQDEFVSRKKALVYSIIFG